MQQREAVSVLVAPLDWGLGHATRCIPIIKELSKQGVRVLLACSGPQKALLRAEFPDLEIFELPGYDIRYQNGHFLKWGLVFGIPAILKQIKRENRWLADFIQLHRPDAVISDNRYGLYHPKVYSVFLTHQLAIRSGMGSLSDQVIKKWNYRLIKKFSVCWIPDWQGKISLAGKLSQPSGRPPFLVNYIGVLSRFRRLDTEPEKNSLLVLISGPEPQRTDFENLILLQVRNLSMKCTVVRGLPGNNTAALMNGDHIRIYDHLPSVELNVLLNNSEIIVTRSGYSSIMDLVQLGRNGIVIPTTGQPEQEYLGIHLQKMKLAVSFPEKNFNLKEAIQQLQTSNLSIPPAYDNRLEEVVAQLITTCKTAGHSNQSRL
jgi:UDP:flavonoid glycosyltransferase YjiC (YdhE family)